ncbi:MAG: hypothetical protein ACRYG2_00575 [Janthinobacterium lividum]
MPKVLFVGDDAASTQIAETLLRRLVGDRVEIRTAGAQPPDPGGRADQMLVMMGLDPAHEERLSVSSLHSSDRVVILSTTLDVARVPGRAYEEWDVENDDLAERVRALAIDLLGREPDRRTRPLDVVRRFLAPLGKSLRRRSWGRSTGRCSRSRSRRPS